MNGAEGVRGHSSSREGQSRKQALTAATPSAPPPFARGGSGLPREGFPGAWELAKAPTPATPWRTGSPLGWSSELYPTPLGSCSSLRRRSGSTSFLWRERARVVCCWGVRGRRFEITWPGGHGLPEREGAGPAGLGSAGTYAEAGEPASPPPPAASRKAPPPTAAVLPSSCPLAGAPARGPSRVERPECPRRKGQLALGLTGEQDFLLSGSFQSGQGDKETENRVPNTTPRQQHVMAAEEAKGGVPGSPPRGAGARCEHVPRRS